VAEVAHAEGPEDEAGCAGEFWGVIGGDGVGHEASGNEVVKELTMVGAGRGFGDWT